MQTTTLTNTGAPVNLLLRKGSAFGRTITYKTNGVVQNISGYTFASQIRTTSGVLAATFSCTIVNAAQGQFSISLAAPAIGGLTIGTTYVWDLECTQSGLTFELMRGTVTVVDEATQ
jgi:hypothetical protein